MSKASRSRRAAVGKTVARVGRRPVAALAAYLLIDVFNLEAYEPPLDFPIRYRAFIAVIGRDGSDAQAALRLVLAQPSISSQIIDNLNASIHVRALLTDLFLIDEVLKALHP